MPPIIPQRMAARMDGSFVVFLIGMRFNKPWKVWKWLPVLRAMPRMIAELKRQPELGLLGADLWFGRTAIVVQYWKSFEQLKAYAKARDRAHLPAWAAFNTAVGTSGDVGIWHETYLVEPGKYEAIYINMPRFGLGAAGELVEATGPLAKASGRLGAGTG